MTGRPVDPGLDADLARLRSSRHQGIRLAAGRVEAELARLREQVDPSASDEIAESALWLDAVSEAFPDFDFSGCYDFDDLRKHMVGQAARLREELFREEHLRLAEAREREDALDRAYQARDDWKAEAQRLREERDEARNLHDDAVMDRAAFLIRAEAAEARCARLQQALTEANERYGLKYEECAQLEAEALAFDNVRAAYDDLIEERARLQQALRGLRESIRIEPYRGVKYKILCPRCGGLGEVGPENHDDPKAWPCSDCEGLGVRPPVLAAIRSADEALAGPDTPADSPTNQTRGEMGTSWNKPADSQEDKRS